MENTALITAIRQDLQNIAESRNPEAVHLLIRSVNRSVRKLLPGTKGGDDTLIRLGIDLLESYRSEMALLQMTGKKRTLSAGFYKSFAVLRKDLEKALDQLKG